MDQQYHFEFNKDLFDYPCKDFIKHLSTSGNTRILFSGKFGIGKSYFLDHFFKEKVQISTMSEIKYRAFHIYPVNYSIASNEDIFRYLKYDVITAMLLNKIELEESDLTYFNTLPKYLKGKLLKVLATIIYMIPKVGKDVYNSYEKIEKLKDEFLKYHEVQSTTQGDILIEFLEELETKEGSIFENDVITKLISNILERLKEKTKQENILIIDDLDRIDPEHIFRLLNVFAAHLDNPGGLPNKLGFDKIVVVCDIKNLRNIFRAKYGGLTDFNGYIDKYYSYEIYQFDNRKILENISIEAFKSIRMPTNDPQSLSYFKDQHFRSNSLAIDLLRIFVYYGLISLRNLKNRIESKIELDPTRQLKFDDKTTVFQLEHTLLTHFKILKEITGGYDTLKEFLNRVQLNDFKFPDLNQICNKLLFFIHWSETLRGDGEVVLEGTDKKFFMRIANGKIPHKLSNLLVYAYDTKLNSSTDQYKFTPKEFLILLNEFIDLLISLEN